MSAAIAARKATAVTVTAAMAAEIAHHPSQLSPLNSIVFYSISDYYRGGVYGQNSSDHVQQPPAATHPCGSCHQVRVPH